MINGYWYYRFFSVVTGKMAEQKKKCQKKENRMKNKLSGYRIKKKQNWRIIKRMNGKAYDRQWF